jgi:hypothetical protein
MATFGRALRFISPPASTGTAPEVLAEAPSDHVKDLRVQIVPRPTPQLIERSGQGDHPNGPVSLSGQPQTLDNLLEAAKFPGLLLS